MSNVLNFVQNLAFFNELFSVRSEEYVNLTNTYNSKWFSKCETFDLESDFDKIWMPIDPNAVLQWHRITKRAPATFPPREGSFFVFFADNFSENYILNADQEKPLLKPAPVAPKSGKKSKKKRQNPKPKIVDENLESDAASNDEAAPEDNKTDC